MLTQPYDQFLQNNGASQRVNISMMSMCQKWHIIRAITMLHTHLLLDA